MTLSQALSWARQELNPITDQAFWESLALLSQITEYSQEQILAYEQKPLTSEQEAVFLSYVKRRLSHEPLAYILGHKEFFGLDFLVDPRVLIPRPETELLVEKALEIAALFPAPAMADIGTGCGAIAISLALKLPQAQIYATDSSPQTLEVAKINCRWLGVERKVKLLQGELLEPLPQPVDILIANLPYIPQEEIAHLPQEVRLFEPLIALNGGKDGLEKIAAFLEQLPYKLSPQGYFLLEIGQGQTSSVQEMARRALPHGSLSLFPDLAGIPRVVLGSSSPERDCLATHPPNPLPLKRGGGV